jgi:hypothetical protein
VADADEAFREQVQQESPQELVERQVISLGSFCARSRANEM